jgi:hypothetical protein
MGAVGAGALLLAVFLLVVAVFVWQGARRSPATDYAEYVIPEAAEFVFDRLSDRALGYLALEDVRNILEWNLQYTQVLSPRATDEERVIGTGDGLEYVLEQAAARGETLEPFDVAEVMAIETEYLLSIGAIGLPVEESP